MAKSRDGGWQVWQLADGRSYHRRILGPCVLTVEVEGGETLYGESAHAHALGPGLNTSSSGLGFIGKGVVAAAKARALDWAFESGACNRNAFIKGPRR